MHKGSSAVVLLASQLWRPMSKPEVVLKLSFDSELLATSMFFAIETPFFEVHTLDMVGQSAFGVEHSNTLGIAASQLWCPVSMSEVVLNIVFSSKLLATSILFAI